MLDVIRECFIYLFIHDENRIVELLKISILVLAAVYILLLIILNYVGASKNRVFNGIIPCILR